MHFLNASVVDIDNKQAAQKDKRTIDIHICIVHNKLDQSNI